MKKKSNFKTVFDKFGFAFIFSVLFILGYIHIKINALNEAQILEKYAFWYKDFWQPSSLYKIFTMNFFPWNDKVFSAILILFPLLFLFNCFYKSKKTLQIFVLFSILITFLQYLIFIIYFKIQNFNDAAPSNMLHAMITFMCLEKRKYFLFVVILLILTFFNLLDFYLDSLGNGSHNSISHILGQFVGIFFFFFTKNWGNFQIKLIKN